MKTNKTLEFFIKYLTLEDFKFSEREKFIFDSRLLGRSFADIARDLSVSPTRVQHQEDRVVRKLKHFASIVRRRASDNSQCIDGVYSEGRLLESLGFDTRIANALRRAGYFNEGLIRLGIREGWLTKVKGLSDWSVTKIKDVIKHLK